eukprot:CAMPEP_0204843942 /NCGR_PEP_ID=MMETSP1346-20131115/48272_1 /ASSEMBLY_ACC=CAM_ASM_000771 /TAXON_ID=215587 /ORGANISM="Aplanochytrium stocchinoi, Strain GSBS06" /LENGTH=153 /DNA_ID=CAMNT_0051983165 /DNA_START=114 /DNA_END=572 /DNA_ORIENTATION=-
MARSYGRSGNRPGQGWFSRKAVPIYCVFISCGLLIVFFGRTMWNFSMALNNDNWDLQSEKKPRLKFATFTLGKEYVTEEFRNENVVRMAAAFPDFSIFKGYHGMDEKSLHELMNRFRDLELRINDYYASRCLWRGMFGMFMRPFGIESMDKAW